MLNILQINIECFCAVWNEIRITKKLYNAYRQWIKFQSLAMFMMDILVYALCSQLLVIYYKQTALELKKMTYISLKSSLRRLTQLHSITTELHNSYGFILKAKCLYIMVTLIQTIYSTVNFKTKKRGLLLFWQIFATADMCLRLWLICYTGDRIRNAVRQIFYSLNFSRYSISSRCNVVI